MKLAILGATGRTGQSLILQAIKAGHQVVAVVRDPEKLRDIEQNVDDFSLKIVKGDIYSSDSLQPIFDGCDAVLSGLGGQTLFSTVTLYSRSCKAIVEAMRHANVKRFVVITSWYTQVDPKDDPGFVARWVIRPMLKKVLSDMLIMETYLETECQDIDYTAVRPAQLNSKQSTGQPFVVEERQFVNASTSIPRADVARFMLQCLDEDKYYKKFLAIGVK
ncbi:flavin reductase (NADPH)-like [Lytechinus variegatus]|uniref:flavin reductase (NADPH)-like n=1 Tax=Lytechinus variegatus TaxID=7654 RepID=UPI001BB1DE91|nr:flavin reductase (NADPH)-like [Lytechinus variegatus]